MKTFYLAILLSTSFLFAETANIGKYQVATTSVTTKKGTYIVETVIDTESGAIVKRKKIKVSSYKLPYKDRRNNIIKEDKLK